MGHRQEKQETSLKKNLQTVLKDKQKIEDTIAELDRYKRDALVKTWEQVTKYVLLRAFSLMWALTLIFRLFGEIFADLLPGNFAKLQPPEGQDIVQGLEVKVRLGSVWKQSLTELSGGQRFAYRHLPVPLYLSNAFADLSSHSRLFSPSSNSSPRRCTFSMRSTPLLTSHIHNTLASSSGLGSRAASLLLLA
jgi:hypothetical protein